MMTPYILGQLLKQSSKQEIYFNSFLSKNKCKFDNSISIRFSARKYEGVDIHKFFYDNFKEFVIKDLEYVNDKVEYENWVYDLAEKRIKEIRSKVDREAARILTQKGGEENWKLAYDIICREYRDVIMNVVLSCFKDDKYKGYKEEIAHVLVQNFYISRTNPTPISSIENYENWLFVCLKNFSNNKRKEIETELGIRDIITISIDSNQDNKVKKECSSSAESEFTMDTIESTSQPSTHLIQDENDNEVEATSQRSEALDIPDEGESENELERYFALMTSPKYVELIRAIKIEKVPVEVLAEEWDCTKAAIYNMMNEAMAMLVSVALPEIRVRMKKMYLKCEPFFNTNTIDVELFDYEKIVLKELFENGLRLNDIALKYHRPLSTTSAKMYSALNKVKRIYHNLDKENYLKDEEVESYKGQFWNC